MAEKVLTGTSSALRKELQTTAQKKGLHIRLGASHQSKDPLFPIAFCEEMHTLRVHAFVTAQACMTSTRWMVATLLTAPRYGCPAENDDFTRGKPPQTTTSSREECMKHCKGNSSTTREECMKHCKGNSTTTMRTCRLCSTFARSCNILNYARLAS